jgi:methyltransferase family protein
MRPARGELWERRGDARRLLIVRAGRAAVYGRWFDGGEVEEWPARVFAARFHPALDNADYRAALPERRRRLVDDQRDLLTGRTVLELGSHTGGLTAGILRYTKRITIIEGNRRAVEALARRLGTRIQIVRGDLHRELWRRRPRAYDVIICAGVLYHSAHPFWILEGIAHLAPRLVLIDTLNPARRTALGTAYTPGVLNHRHGRGPDCGVALNLGDDAIDYALDCLGYRRLRTIAKPAPPQPRRDSPYLRAWRRSLSAWYLRSDSSDPTT